VIKNYQIIAPTEWNFHPSGVAALSLHTLTATDESTLRHQATVLIDAFDPCVKFELSLNRPSVAHF
jgi:Ni,Fe-hydrogenase I large subunit